MTSISITAVTSWNFSFRISGAMNSDCRSCQYTYIDQSPWKEEKRKERRERSTDNCLRMSTYVRSVVRSSVAAALRLAAFFSARVQSEKVAKGKGENKKQTKQCTFSQLLK
jgi:hypothetical protein